MAGLTLGFVLVGALLQAPTGQSQPDRTDSTRLPGDSSRALDPVFDSAAVVAWRQFERLWIPESGLAKATFDYDKLTTWDMGSVMAALYSGRVLGFLDPIGYNQRMSRTLRTLAEMPLFRDSVFHKLYDAHSGRMVNRDGRESDRGYAWSATDLGRFLVWLRIVANGDPAFAPLTRQIADRMHMDRVVMNGYMHGEDATPGRRRYHFQEGRIGYEQYAAHGFGLWGHDVALAEDLHTNSQPVTVLGVELLKDTRGLDRLTSEPLVLMGLELGWSPDEDRFARAVLEAQAQRYRETKIITIVSEDAVGIAPHYFYYYCVYCSGRAFVVETHAPGQRVSSPRWVSTKATFGWHALLPSEYTQLAVERIQRARATVGWSSGVLERSGAATRSYDINTAAIILEAAAYRKLGRPLLVRDSLSAPAR
ncbi:MAG TPA: DUF3131 domain-containing protein [Gemmatimonadaceae bacterium]|nr:DUF3131 domain-containing protein [Gemmatimonadaceae bacterium]